MRPAGDPPPPDDSVACALLRRAIIFLAVGDAYAAIQSVGGGFVAFGVLSRTYGVTNESRGRSDAIQAITALSFNVYSKPELLTAVVRRLRVEYPEGDESFFSMAMVTALHEPRAPAAFAPLHTQLIFLDSPSVETISMMLTEYYNDHRDAIEPALGLLAPAAAGRLLPTPPPMPQQPRTVGDPTRTWCACCYGFGHAAGDCPSDPHLTATMCALYCIAGHTLESCKRKPERWALGGGRST